MQVKPLQEDVQVARRNLHISGKKLAHLRKKACLDIVKPLQEDVQVS
jgi:hypothetical protein